MRESLTDDLLLASLNVYRGGRKNSEEVSIRYIQSIEFRVRKGDMHK
jgi:hypothetical protein